MTITEKKLSFQLRRQGYKLTPQRRKVLSVIAASREHLSPTAIYDRVRQQQPHIGRVTIYRTLEILVRLGLICEVHVGGNCRSYLMSHHEHHHHLVCSSCGTVIDFVDCGLDELEKKLGRGTGFKIDNHLLEFIGECQSCSQTSEKKPV